MTTILTVDDSRALRTIINKSLSNEFDIIEAEDGTKGLEALDANQIDLVLLDVTMPVMDGPAMLTEMRARGHNHPVILLTAESKTTLIGGMMGQGVSDYILKPFQAEELRAKVQAVLRPTQAAAAGGPTPSYAQQHSANAGPAPASGRPFVDILIVDDMENVAKKFRDMLPGHIKVKTALDGQSAMQAARDMVFRTIVVDTVIPDVNSAALASQLRVLQPTAAFLGLYMRNTEHPVKISREQGYDGFLVKPFDIGQVDQFLAAYYDAQDVLVVDDNVLSPSSFPEGKERRAQFVSRLAVLANEAVEKAAAACFEDVIINLEHTMPADSLPRFLLAAMKRCGDMGLTLRVVASKEVSKQMASLSDTASIPTYSTIQEAQQAAA